VRSLTLAFVLSLGALGCGPGDPKPAPKPTDEVIKADMAAQKSVEAEEKGPQQQKKTK
jgi:hypothetical protein